MKQSEKLKLWLPEGTDPLEVSKLSENFEKLDPLGSGVEALRDGMGVGSLFMVSKYYQEPIKNALLCNGGSADPAAYPELYEVLGTAYGGGSLSLTSLNAQYGITSTDGYPAAYNAEHDMYIAKASDHLVLYRKGQTPQQTALPAELVGYTRLYLSSFGDGIYIAAYVSAWKYQAYDLAKRVWLGNVGAAGKIAQIGNEENCLIRSGNYLFFALNNTVYWVEIGEANPTLHSFIMSSGAIFPVLNLDHTETERVYFYLNHTIVYATISDIINFPASVTASNFRTVATLSTLSISSTSTATHLNPITSSQMIIFNNHLYQFNSVYLVGCNLASPSSGMKKLFSASSRFGEAFGYVQRLSGDSILVCSKLYPSAPNTNFYILKGLTASAVSNSRTPNMDTQWIGEPAFITTSGIYGDLGIGSFKLPSITMSEALVYIRAKSE